MLRKDQLVHGMYYKGRCRNATIARWNSYKQCVYHWREKFGRIYIETIKHPDDEVQLDVFEPFEQLTNPKLEIPFDPSAVFAGNLQDLSEFDEEMWTWKLGE